MPRNKQTLKETIDKGKEQQNNLGYEDFVRYVTQGDEFGERVSAQKLGRRFKHHRNTIHWWIARLQIEQPELKIR